MGGAAYPPKPEADKISDQFSDNNSINEEINNFQPYPMKPEADLSLSLGDDELGTVTPQKMHREEEIKTSEIETKNGIEIIQNKKKKSKKKYTSQPRDYKPNYDAPNEIKLNMKHTENNNEVEYKREGSQAPQKQQSGKICGKYGKVS